MTATATAPVPVSPSASPSARTPGDVTATMTQPLQPLLHDSVVLLAAPSQVWSRADGEVDGHGIHGFYHSDVRVLGRIELTVDGCTPEHIATAARDAANAVFTSLARTVDDRTADPRVRVDRARTVRGDGVGERITVRNALSEPIRPSIAVTVHADFSAMQLVKAGLGGNGEPVETVGTTDGVEFACGGTRTVLVAPGAAVEVGDGSVTFRWSPEIGPHSQVALGWDAAVDDRSAVVGPAAPSPEWAAFSAATGDSRLSSWLRRAVADLQALRMSTIERPDDVFLAAGAPWFFTLFGRDSLWAARMLLPLGTELAASTLRILAHLQGTRTVAATAEQPGKIMHELRPGTLTIPGENVELPPLYYGTVDATPLWILLLHDAWKWGMPAEQIEALLPNLEAALGWMRDHGDSDGDGFLEYADTTGHGLANQGWKDSGDSIQWNDGSLAEGPIALSEVQGYAYEAALGGAALLESFGRPGADEWRDWAARLKQRFGEAFWIEDADGAYPAIALDAAKRRVDTVASNMGHLLGTGILTEEQAALVARRLASPDLDSGYGLRTMSAAAGGFWPLSYHGGSVWAHDTAIAIMGLTRAGHRDVADSLAEGLLAAAEGFGYRMPELHAGDAAADTPSPVPYPAACRPQAWSAAAAVVVLSARLGLDADATAGRVDVHPSSAAGTMTIAGLRFAGAPLGVTVGPDGTAEVVAGNGASAPLRAAP